MKKQRQKWVCFLAVLTLVLAVLCACGTQPEQEEEPAPVQETEPKGTEASAGNTVDMGDYVLTLPKDCTQQARDKPTVLFVRNLKNPSSVTAPLWAASRPWTARGRIKWTGTT